MFKILGHNIRKSLALFVVFFTISIVFSVFSSFIESQRKDSVINNEIFSNKFITFNFKDTKKGIITNDDFIKTLHEENGIIISKPINITTSDKLIYSGNAIYFNKSCKNVPPMYEGNFFTLNDFSENVPIAIVGKELLKFLVTKENQKYLIFDNKPYKVVGVMGYKDKKSLYDGKFFINLDSAISDMNSFKKDLSTVRWKFDNIDISPQDSLNNIFIKLYRIDKNLKIDITSSSGQFNPLTNAISIYKSAIVMLIIFIIVLFLNIINISSYWVIGMKKEIGIRKALGGTNKSIIIRIIFKYQIITFLSAIFALLVHLILIKFSISIKYLNTLYNIESQIDIINVCILIIFAVIVGLIVSFIPIKQIIKMEANDIIRGR